MKPNRAKLALSRKVISIVRHSSRAGVVLALLCSFTATLGYANSEARSFCNDTGAPTNDWHVLVRNGAPNLNYVRSDGLAPTFAPMPNSNAPAGGGPYNGATLSGGNVPAGGCVSVNYGYNALTPGNLDWYWTNNGNQVGKLHKDGQQWYFSVSNAHSGVGDVKLTIVNTSVEDAQYSNFEAGTTPTDETFGPWSFDPGQIPSPSDIYVGPTDFTVPAGQFRVYSFFDVFVDLHLEAYGNVTLPDESFFQLTDQIPEPGSVGLLGIGIAGCAAILRRRLSS